MFRTLRHEGMLVPFAVPEAGLQTLGARGAEEGSLGFGDPHGRSLSGWWCSCPVPAVSGGRFLENGECRCKSVSTVKDYHGGYIT